MFIFMTGEKQERRTGKGGIETQKKKKEFILHYHNTLACIGIGNREGIFLQETKGESEDV